MEYRTEPIDAVTSKIIVNLAASDIESQYKKQLAKKAKTAEFKGFRKGKVPIHLVEQYSGPSVLWGVGRELMQKSWSEILDKENLPIISYPEFEIQNIQKDQMEFHIEYEIAPQVDLEKIAEISCEIVEALEETQAEVDETIERIRKKQGELKELPEGTLAELGHQVTIDFDGTIDGKAFEGSKNQGVSLEIGKEQFIPGFEEAIVGMRVGETKIVDLKFPEDYENEAARGKDAQFAIHLEKLEKLDLPEMNEDFFSKFNLPEPTLECLQKDIAKQLKKEVRKQVYEFNRGNIFKALHDGLDMTLPKNFIAQEASRRAEKLHKSINQMKKVPQDIPEEYQLIIKKQATEDVKIMFVFQEAKSKWGIEISDEMVDARVLEEAETYDDPNEVLEFYKNNKKEFESMRSFMQEEAYVENLKQRMQTTTKTQSVKELMDR